MPRSPLSSLTYRLFEHSPQRLGIMAQKIKLRAQYFLIAVSVAALVTAFVFAVNHYATGKSAILTQPLVYQAEQFPLVAKVKFGLPKLCPSPSHDCYVDPKYADDDWTIVDLPKTPIRSLSGFAEGLKTGQIYYRIHITVPEPLVRSQEIISFSPVYVGHRFYEIYLNGKQVGSGSGALALGAIAIVTIPRHELREGQASLVIRATLDAGDDGIYHRGPLLLGPKTALDQLYVGQERTGASYYLLFVLSKASIFLVFAMIFAFSRRKASMFSFLLFALCVTLEEILKGSFLYFLLDLNAQASLYFSIRALGILALLNFILQQYNATGARNAYYIFATLTLALTAAGLYDYTAGTNTVSLDMLFALTNALLVYCVAIGLAIGLLREFFQRRPSAHGQRIPPSTIALTGILGIYLVLIIWEIYFTPYLGFDKRAIYDLGLFYFIAFVTAKNYGYNERLVAAQVRELADARVAAAVGRMTQMLAHDVRRPFSVLRILTNLIQSEKDAERIKTLTYQTLDEVERVQIAVEGMLEDVLEIGRKAALKREPCALSVLLEVSLSLLKPYLSPQVKFHYYFDHRHLLLVNAHQIQRALTNIILNAIEATKAHCTITIRSTDQQVAGAAIVRLEIHNTNSYIAPQDREKLFDAFFTAGKPRGTGLGLAVTKKVAEEHGGRVWCESGENGTSFFLELPASSEPAQETPDRLPLSGKDKKETTTHLPARRRVIDTLHAFTVQHQRPLRMLILDDETVYMKIFSELLAHQSEIGKLISLTTMDQYSPAAVKNLNPDIAIIDINLGKDAPSGFDVAKEIANALPRCLIRLHSNSSMDQAADSAFAVILKPMNQNDLYTLILDLRSGENPPALDLSPQALVAVVDDSIFLRQAWAKSVKDAKVICFDGPREFWAHAAMDPPFLESLDAVVTDFHFRQGEVDGAMFARDLRAKIACPIILSSESTRGEIRDADAFDAFITKEPRPYAALRILLDASRSKR